MSSFAFENLEGRQLFSGGYTINSLVGDWGGSVTVPSLQYTAPTEIAIFKYNKNTIDVEGLYNEDGYIDIYLKGSVKSNGQFSYSGTLYDDGVRNETIAIKGRVTNNSLYFTEYDTFTAVVQGGIGTYDYIDIFNLTPAAPI
jgi:hypothetical protein